MISIAFVGLFVCTSILAVLDAKNQSIPNAALALAVIAVVLIALLAGSPLYWPYGIMVALGGLVAWQLGMLGGADAKYLPLLGFILGPSVLGWLASFAACLMLQASLQFLCAAWHSRPNSHSSPDSPTSTSVPLFPWLVLSLLIHWGSVSCLFS